MSEERRRSETGEFSSEVTEQDILLVFDSTDDPFMTAKEIADELPITRDAVLRRLKDMEDEGLVGSKRTGARAVGWWAKVAPKLDPELAEELEKKAEKRKEYVPLHEIGEIKPDDDIWGMSGFATPRNEEEEIGESDIDEILYGDV
jgi:DNA-binding MarR family transcriptional regulator